MQKLTICDLEGGPALCAWFEGTPTFHDATIRVLELRQGASGRLVADVFKMTSEVDTLTIHDLIQVNLLELKEAAIIGDFDLEGNDDGIVLRFDSSYGAHGMLKAKRIVVTFEPAETA